MISVRDGVERRIGTLPMRASADNSTSAVKNSRGGPLGHTGIDGAAQDDELARAQVTVTRT